MVTGFDLIHDNKPLQKHWVKRLIAYILDFLISSVLVYLIFLFFFWVPGLGAWWYFPMTAGMVQVFYSAVLEYSYKKTIGKAVMGLEVGSLTQTFDMPEALIRNVSKLHGILLLLDWLGGMLSEGDPRQRYLDRLAETTVTGTGEPVHVGDFFEDHIFREKKYDEREEEKEKKQCRECGGTLVNIGEERYRCRDCGRIQ